MAPVIRCAIVFVGLLSLKMWTKVPNSSFRWLKSGLSAPLTTARGLKVVEMPFGEGNIFLHLIAKKTNSETMIRGIRLKGKPWVRVRQSFLTVRIDRSTTST